MKVRVQSLRGPAVFVAINNETGKVYFNNGETDQGPTFEQLPYSNYIIKEIECPHHQKTKKKC